MGLPPTHLLWYLGISFSWPGLELVTFLRRISSLLPNKGSFTPCLPLPPPPQDGLMGFGGDLGGPGGGGRNSLRNDSWYMSRHPFTLTQGAGDTLKPQSTVHNPHCFLTEQGGREAEPQRLTWNNLP